MPAALVAAYLLLIQTTLGAFAFATVQDAALLDPFGNVICTHEGAAQPSGGDPHQQHMPACCMLGCSTASAAHAPPPDAGAFATSLSFEAVAFALPAFRHLDLARDRSPSNPRAPPAS
ncbi:hypothetical protein LJR234_002006 [Mesorhizobium amorphae]|jgi:hypothetical protein|uniref:DUF2946 family protein n=1 Tax=Mesorhizobium amorphae TaxID=71433 RepID=UPI003ED0A66A